MHAKCHKNCCLRVWAPISVSCCRRFSCGQFFWIESSQNKACWDAEHPPHARDLGVAWPRPGVPSQNTTPVLQRKLGSPLKQTIDLDTGSGLRQTQWSYQRWGFWHPSSSSGQDRKVGNFGKQTHPGVSSREKAWGGHLKELWSHEHGAAGSACEQSFQVTAGE